MELYKEGKLVGDFKGWGQDHFFEFTNGQIWKQKNYKYSYHYAYRPSAKIFQEGSQYYLEVAGMNEVIEVKKSTRDEMNRSKKEKEQNGSNTEGA